VQTVHLPERVVEDSVLEAIAALSAKVTALAPAPTPTVNITHLWASFELAERGRLRSWRDYAQRWRDHVGPYFGAMDAHAVGPAEVDLYRAVRRELVAIATVNREVALLRRLVNFGVRRGMVRKSLLHGPGMTRELIHPEHNVRTTVIEQHADTGITLADLLLEAGPQLRAYIVLVHHSGLRRAEAALLRRDRIRNGVAWVPSAETKGGRSGRIVPLSSEALAALAELPPTETYLFESPRRKGQPIHKDVWTHRFCRLVRRLGLDGPDGGPPWLHDLRRSFVTLARRDGEAEKDIMNVSGHKTRAVFERYDIHDARDVIAFRERREAARALLSAPRKPPHRSPDRDVDERNVLTKGFGRA
jgi:integrase